MTHTLCPSGVTLAKAKRRGHLCTLDTCLVCSCFFFFFFFRYLLRNNANVAAVNNDGDLPYDICEDDEMEKLLQEAMDEQGSHLPRSKSSRLDTSNSISCTIFKH